MKSRSIITVVCIVSILSCFIFPAAVVRAETKTFIKEYTYQAGDEDSKNSCRVISLREVKRLLLEELGTYLESETEVKNFQMTKDQIVTLTAGIVRTELTEEKWNTQNLQYWLKAKITANPQDVTKAIDTLRKDRVKVKELEDLRKKSEELLKENERLTKELKTAKGNEKTEAAQAYKQNIDNMSAAEWSERGYELVTSGNYTEAVKAFSKALELNPQDAMAYARRGLTYSQIGQYQRAIEDYNEAIIRHMPDAKAAAYLARGIAYADLGQHQRAIEDYSEAILMKLDFPLIYTFRGIAYHKLNQHQEAIKDFNEYIRMKPGDYDTYCHRGSVYGKLGQHQRAIKDFSEAIRLKPDYPNAYSKRGATYLIQGKIKLYCRDAQKACDLGDCRLSDLAEKYGNCR